MPVGHEGKVKFLSPPHGVGVYGGMKTRHCSLRAAALAAAVLIQASVLDAQIPASASLTVGPVNASTTGVQLTDPGDHVWILQSSANFTNWTEVGAWRSVVCVVINKQPARCAMSAALQCTMGKRPWPLRRRV